MAVSEPQFSKIEADRILRRAAEIEGADEGRPLSARELRLIAREAGFGADAVERALAEAREAAAPSTRRTPVQKWGLIFTKMSTVRELPLEIDSEQLMRVVRLFHPYREGAPHLKLEEREVTWRDGKGIRFAVTSSGGATHVRVFASKFALIRRGRWMGWLKNAADRLETLVQLVADTEVARAPEERGHLPPTRAGEGRGQGG